MTYYDIATREMERHGFDRQTVDRLGKSMLLAQNPDWIKECPDEERFVASMKRWIHVLSTVAEYREVARQQLDQKLRDAVNN